MIFKPEEVLSLRAMAAAERSLFFVHPNGVECDTRETLALWVLAGMYEGERNPMTLSRIAVEGLGTELAPNAA